MASSTAAAASSKPLRTGAGMPSTQHGWQPVAAKVARTSGTCDRTPSFSITTRPTAAACTPDSGRDPLAPSKPATEAVLVKRRVRTLLHKVLVHHLSQNGYG